MIVNHDFFRLVAANTELYETAVVPDGETWEVSSWYGSANPNRDTHVCLIWDYDGEGAEIFALTYASEQRNLGRQFVGDGAKKLAIVLVNDSASPEKLGAGYEMRAI